MDNPYIIQRPNADGTVTTTVFDKPSQDIVDMVDVLMERLGLPKH